MTTEMWIVLIFLGLAGMAGAFWSARRVDRQQARAADIMTHATEQQRASDELQQREAELLSRWEAVVTRLETVADRWEARVDAERDTAANKSS